MYKIGEFSVLSKTSIKTLRYYEKEGLLIPAFIDPNTGYRFYESTQLIGLSKIISLRQIGLSINNIKEIINGKSTSYLIKKRKEKLQNELFVLNNQLSRINYLMEEKNMEYEVIIKELPDYMVYYKEGIIKNFGEITNFILSSAEECKKTNPNIKCVEPGYCYVSYLDGEYKDNDISILYAQAVTEEGIPNETIKFKKLESVNAVCVYHKGSYSNLGLAYGFVLKWIEENGYEISQPIRESYIDGMWNKDNPEEWLTEIQVPIKKK